MKKIDIKGIEFQSTRNNRYFYDDYTGIIFSLEHGQEKEEYLSKYRQYTQDTYRTSDVASEISVNDVKEYLYHQGNGFRQIIFSATSQCNLRCKYCIYSDHYPFTDHYSDEYMDFETARKALDYYFENFSLVHYRNPTRQPVIGFYGGEPLLSVDLMKEITGYVRKTYPEYQPMYNITTNGVLFTGENQEFLVDNDFSIIISLDGDQENHDRNRIKRNGQGSFADIMSNIYKFQAEYPSYHKWGIAACFDYTTDLVKVGRFIDENNLFLVRLSQIDPANSTYYSQFSEEDARVFSEKYESLIKEFQSYTKVNAVHKDSFLYSMIGITYLEFAYHSMCNETRPFFLPYSGACVPGEKMYVTEDGNIHMCERVNTRFPIGNVDDGIDFKRVTGLINEYNMLLAVRCKDCNVKRLCNRCFQQVAGNGELALSDNGCQTMEKKSRDMLTRYIDILEDRPEMFEEITVDYYTNIYNRIGEKF